jgi:hypothetical protein
VTVLLDAPVAERLAKLIRMLGSDRGGEVVSAAAAIVRTLEAKGRDLHDLAAIVTVKKPERKTSKEDLLKAYREGYRDGARQADDNVDDNVLSWREIALFCRARADRLEVHERDFVAQMCRWTADGRELSDKQAAWLLYLHTRLKHDRKRRRRPARARRE